MNILTPATTPINSGRMNSNPLEFRASKYRVLKGVNDGVIRQLQQFGCSNWGVGFGRVPTLLPERKVLL